VVRVLAMAERRGPASQAQTLYADSLAAPAAAGPPDGPRGTGRPTKRDRRALDRLRHGEN
jgi:ribosome-associated heat shock protein Hsp15